MKIEPAKICSASVITIHTLNPTSQVIVIILFRNQM